MHTRVERSVSVPAVIRQRREIDRFKEERKGRGNYGEEYGGRNEAMRRCIVLMLGRS